MSKSFDPIDYLTLCDSLIGTCNNNQSVIRTIIGRAYYASFLKTREWLKSHGVIFSKTHEDHEKVKETLRQKYQYLTGIGDKFGKLQRQRIKADYEIEAFFIRTDAVESIEIAKEIAKNIH